MISQYHKNMRDHKKMENVVLRKRLNYPYCESLECLI